MDTPTQKETAQQKKQKALEKAREKSLRANLVRRKMQAKERADAPDAQAGDRDEK